MRTFRFAALAAAALLFFPQGSDAQAPDSTGPRVRISIPTVRNGNVVRGTDKWIVGNLTLADTRGLAIAVQGDPERTMEVPLDVIRAMQVSRGPNEPAVAGVRSAVRGSIIAGGLVLGLSLALRALGSGDIPEEQCTWDCELTGPTNELLVRNVAIAGVSGAVVGGLLGSAHTEVWDGVSPWYARTIREQWTRENPGQ